MHYNSKRKISNVSYTSDMLDNQVKPYPKSIWNYGTKQSGANLISVDNEKLRLTLLPRTTGAFSRKGLTVNGLRYKHDGFTEQFLKGGSCVVSYDPNNVSSVWLVEGGKYVEFELIESRYKNKSLSECEDIQTKVKELTPESVKLDCSKVLDTRMKSSASSILTHLIFYTHLVQIQTPNFLLKKQYLSAFQTYFAI